MNVSFAGGNQTVFPQPKKSRPSVGDLMTMREQAHSLPSIPEEANPNLLPTIPEEDLKTAPDLPTPPYSLLRGLIHSPTTQDLSQLGQAKQSV